MDVAGKCPRIPWNGARPMTDCCARWLLSAHVTLTGSGTGSTGDLPLEGQGRGSQDRNLAEGVVLTEMEVVVRSMKPGAVPEAQVGPQVSTSRWGDQLSQPCTDQAPQRHFCSPHRRSLRLRPILPKGLKEQHLAQAGGFPRGTKKASIKLLASLRWGPSRMLGARRTRGGHGERETRSTFSSGSGPGGAETTRGGWAAGGQGQISWRKEGPLGGGEASLCRPRSAGDRSQVRRAAGGAGGLRTPETTGEPLKLSVRRHFLGDKTASEDCGEEASHHYAGFYDWQLVPNEC